MNNPHALEITIKNQQFVKIGMGSDSHPVAPAIYVSNYIYALKAQSSFSDTFAQSPGKMGCVGSNSPSRPPHTSEYMSRIDSHFA